MNETTEITYKPLDEPYFKDTFRHELIKRDGNVALYKKIACVTLTRHNEFDCGFEVVRITKHNGYELGGVKIEPAESYPAKNSWGFNGFTYNGEGALDLAQKKFSELVDGCVIGGNDTDDIEDVSEPSKKTEGVKERKSSLPDVKFPTTRDFTMADLLVLNSEYVKPTLYVKLQSMIKEGKVEVTGSLKIEGKKGKPATIFNLKS